MSTKRVKGFDDGVNIDGVNNNDDRPKSRRLLAFLTMTSKWFIDQDCRKNRRSKRTPEMKKPRLGITLGRGFLFCINPAVGEDWFLVDYFAHLGGSFSINLTGVF